MATRSTIAATDRRSAWLAAQAPGREYRRAATTRHAGYPPHTNPSGRETLPAAARRVADGRAGESANGHSGKPHPQTRPARTAPPPARSIGDPHPAAPRPDRVQ